MDIIKGLDRIALILAIIAIVPGFAIGFFGVNEMFKSVTPEYKAWEIRFEDKRRELEKRYSEEVNKYFGENNRELKHFPLSSLWVDEPLRMIEEEAPSIFKYPPIWQRTIGGIFFAPLSFVVVLFGFRGMTRGIKWFSLWIIDGFKNK